MSRPGFVFDLRKQEGDTTSYHCRSCGRSEAGGRMSDAPTLHGRMKAHLAGMHGLTQPEEWRVTQQNRGADEAVVCFWPPEAD